MAKSPENFDLIPTVNKEPVLETAPQIEAKSEFTTLSFQDKFFELLNNYRFVELTDLLKNADKKELKSLQNDLRKDVALQTNFQEKLAEILMQTGLAGLDQTQAIVDQLLTSKKQHHDFFRVEPLQKIANSLAVDALSQDLTNDKKLFNKVNELFVIFPGQARETIKDVYKLLVTNGDIQTAANLIYRLKFNEDDGQYHLLEQPESRGIYRYNREDTKLVDEIGNDSDIKDTVKQYCLKFVNTSKLNQPNQGTDKQILHDICKDALNSREILEALEPAIVEQMERGQLDRAEKISNLFSYLCDSPHWAAYQSSDIICETAGKLFNNFLDQGDYKNAEEFTNWLFKFGLAENYRDIVEDKLTFWLKNKQDQALDNFLDNYSINKKDLAFSTSMRKAIFERISAYLDDGNLEGVKSLVSKLEYDIKEHYDYIKLAKQSAEKFCQQADIEKAKELIGMFDLDLKAFFIDQKIHFATATGVTKLIDQNDFIGAKQFAQTVEEIAGASIWNPLWHSSCMEKGAQKFEELLKQGDYEKIEQLEKDIPVDGGRREKAIANQLYDWTKNNDTEAIEKFFAEYKMMTDTFKDYLLRANEAAKNFFEFSALDYLQQGDMQSLKKICEKVTGHKMDYGYIASYIKTLPDTEKIQAATMAGIIHRLQSEGHRFYENIDFTCLEVIAGGVNKSIENPDFKKLLETVSAEEFSAGKFTKGQEIISQHYLPHPFETPESLEKKEEVRKQALLATFNNGSFYDVIGCLQDFSGDWPDSLEKFRSNSEIKELAEKSYYRLLTTRDLEDLEKLNTRVLGVFFNHKEATAIKQKPETLLIVRQKIIESIDIAMRSFSNTQENVDLIERTFNNFSIPIDAEIKTKAEQWVAFATEEIDKLGITSILKIQEVFKITNQYMASAIEAAIQNNHLSSILNSLNEIPPAILKFIEKDHQLLSYKQDLPLASEEIYKEYLQIKKGGDTMQLIGFTERIKDQIQTLISNEKQSSETSQETHYQVLVEHTFPNHSNNWTNYENNESCPDRSGDLENFKIKEVYKINLAEGAAMELKSGEQKNETGLKNLEKPIAEIQQEFAQVDFDKEKMFAILDAKIEAKIESCPHKDKFKTREEKIYGLLLENLLERVSPDDLKEILIGYQFAEFEDIKTYLEGTRAQAEQAKNPDYAYLLELREFFADHLKEVERKISADAQKNPEIIQILSDYYQEKKNIEQQIAAKERINRSQVAKLGLPNEFLKQLSRVLGEKTNKKYSIEQTGKIVEIYEKNTEYLKEQKTTSSKKRTKAFYGQLKAQREKTLKAIRDITGQEIESTNIHLGEINLQEALQAQRSLSSEGTFNEELFSRYLLQSFQMIFNPELTTIDQELAKYQSIETKQKDKKAKQLECFITKNHTSAHARSVGGVCVSGDNPLKAKKSNRSEQECQWNLPNYLQMILRDQESKICQGVILLHYYEQQDKKILTASFNPSSTYLYTVDEQQLFKGLTEQLKIFAQQNNIDIIAVSQNKAMRTNRTGGEFEQAMDATIREKNQTLSLENEEIFSYSPEYKQKNLDVIWAKE